MKYVSLALAALLALVVFAVCDQERDDPPELAIVLPADGDTLARGPILVKAVATDDGGVLRVEFFVDGSPYDTALVSNADTFSFTWNAVAETPGSEHAIAARAFDTGGNVADDDITVTISRNGGGGSGPTYHRGPIEQDETWYPADNPHVVEYAVYPTSGHTLTILPGCWVEFEAGTGLRVGYSDEAGAIVAVGTRDSSITFTSRSTTAAPGDWDNVGIYSAALPATQFSYCLFEDGGRAGSEMGMVYVDNIGLQLDHCTIQNSGDYGIVCRNGGYFSEFAGNTIRNCAEYQIRIDCDKVGTIGTGNNLSGGANSGIEVVGGSITSSATWPNLGVPYVIDGYISVGGSASPVLTLAPGIWLEFAPGSELYCGHNSRPGAIVAVGTPDSVIVFTSSSASPAPGDWKRVGVYSAALSTAKFDYCGFEYGGEVGSDRGMLYVDDAGVSIDHCTFRHSGDYGIVGHGSGYFRSFTGNSVTNCASYPLRMGCATVGTIGTGNVLTPNTSNGIEVLGGEILASDTWPDNGVPYVLDDDVSVGGAGSPVLTISAGNTIRFRRNVELRCGFNQQPGAIAADGTGDRITFTSDDATPERGDWRSVSFYPSATSESRLVNCNIEYGGYGGANEYGNVFISSSTPTVSGDSIGHGSGWGIYVTGSPVPDTAQLRQNNWFYDNTRGSVGP